jgi:hypothetical protein
MVVDDAFLVNKGILVGWSVRRSHSDKKLFQ